MKEIISIFSSMTKLPLPKGIHEKDTNVEINLKWMPFVGIVIGILNYFLYYILIELNVSILILSASLITLNIVITGAVHLNGLSSTFDGIFGYRSKQKMLDIMKDPNIGTNGALSLIIYFLFKMLFMNEIIRALPIQTALIEAFFGHSSKVIIAIILLIPVFERIGIIINSTTESYALPSGKGKVFVDNTNSGDLIFAYGISMLYTLVVSLVFTSITNSLKLLIIFNLIVAFNYLYGKLITKKIGGVTWDTLGSTVEISSILSLLLIYFIII